MQIQVYDLQKAPKWIRIWNIINVFLFGFAVGLFVVSGLKSNFIYWFIMYACIYGLTIGHFYIPKKKIEFPGKSG